MLKHKGYTGYVEFDDDAVILHGEVLDTKMLSLSRERPWRN